MQTQSGHVDEQNREAQSRSSRLISQMHTRLAGMRGDGLRAKAMRGSSWVLGSFCVQQVLRLGSNLVLTRLLVPEAFGLMALAQVFMHGLNMLSDIGVRHSVVQNESGGDPDFLATAWTMQVLRGFLLAMAMLVLSYPVSRFYSEPTLFPLLIWIGGSAFIMGFQSIGIALANRNMKLGRLVAVELIAYVIGIAAMITWALISPTVWALIGGGMIAGIFRVLLGHILLGSPANRLRINREFAGKIIHFGKWIFFSTALTYMGGRGLMLVQGVLVPIDTLGLLSIAGMLSIAARQLAQKLGATVFFPVFSEIHRDRPHEVLPKLRETRLKLFLFSLPVYVALILFGVPIIELLYDDRYAAAGGYLVVLSVAGAISTSRTPFSMSMLAVGDSFGHACVQFVSAILNIIGVIVGFAIFGVMGMLIATVAAQILVYPIEAWRLRRHGQWLPVMDILMATVYLGLGVVSYMITVR